MVTRFVASLALGLAAMVLVISVAARDWRVARAAEEGVKPKPLIVDKNAPLLLDEAPAENPADKPQGKVADNDSCYVCHGNYREEPFVQSHAKANCGCIQCHGPSLAHRGDEDNITPPDVMIDTDGIEKNCRTCHETHNASAAKVLAMWQEKCPARTDAKDMLCTDCHGEHRLKFRTVWWDKKTGKLGERKPGEKFRPALDLKQLPSPHAQEKRGE